MEEELEDQNWTSLLPKRGSKDYEPDGTNIQMSQLEKSKDAMFTTLSVPRGHIKKHFVKAEWVADRRQARVLNPKGSFLQTCGRVDSQNQCWLNIEEFIYLVERGTVYPVLNNLPMSLQQCYSLFEQGELEQYWCYAQLKRLGYIVLRYQKHYDEVVHQLSFVQRVKSLFTRLYSNILRMLTTSRLLKFTSNESILRSLQIDSFIPHGTKYAKQPVFSIWKPQQSFKKSSPPVPDFNINVINVAKDTFKPEFRNNGVLALVDNGIVNFVHLREFGC